MILVIPGRGGITGTIGAPGWWWRLRMDGPEVSGILPVLVGLASPWAYLLVGLLAAAESAALIGLVLPGETAMLLGGFLAFQGHVRLGWMAAAAAAGAIAGDQLGYLLGRLLGPRLRGSRLGRLVGPDRWARAEAFVRARGGRAVFVGRFGGPAGAGPGACRHGRHALPGIRDLGAGRGAGVGAGPGAGRLCGGQLVAAGRAGRRPGGGAGRR